MTDTKSASEPEAGEATRSPRPGVGPMTNPLQAGVDHAELLKVAVAALKAIRSADIHHEGFDIDTDTDIPAGAVSRTWIGPLGLVAKTALRQIDALRAAPVLPDRGWRPDREAVARIISPSSWEAREAAINEGYEWMDRDPTNWGEDTRTFMRDQRFRDGDGFVSPSLAKADAILALPDAPAEGGE